MPRPPTNRKRQTDGVAAPFHGKRIVIVDDHPLIRRGLERMIQSGDGFEVCGEAANAPEALALVRREKPDLAIVDVSLPGSTNGIDLTRQLLDEFPGLRILVLSMHDEPEFALRALRAGALGYMVKDEAVEKITGALQHILRGNIYLGPSLAPHIRLDAFLPAAV